MKRVLYSTGCPRCEVLKKKLAEKNIDYTEVTSVDKILGLGITQVPMFSVDGKLMDFREAVDWVNNQ